MFASPVYDRHAQRRFSPHEQLSAGQLAFELILKHVGTGTLAVIMLVALAVLSGFHGEKAHPRALLPASGSGSDVVTWEPKDFANKCAPGW